MMENQNKILTKADLAYFLKEDIGKTYNLASYMLKVIELWCRGSEKLPLFRFCYCMRHYEYYLNQSRLSLISKVKKHYWRFKFRHCQLNYSIYIGPNQVGAGLRMLHPGYRFLGKVAHLGHHCTILPMVLIGSRKAGGEVIIGNHVDISTGVTILSPVRIGNNVTIGAGAVVTHDIPDNAIVAGIPAKIIEYNTKES